MRLTARCRAIYHYEAPVGFSPHWVRLFPRQDHALRVRDFVFRTEPGGSVQHRRDRFDNWVARCFFPESSERLRFELQLDIEVRERNPFDFLLDAVAARFPFEYPVEERAGLEGFLLPPGGERVETVPGWRAPGAEAREETTGVLVELNRALHALIRYEPREHGPPRAPVETLARRSGSCRDIALLHAAVLRTHGVATRLASGFLFETVTARRLAEGALHLWTEAYLPGAGWVGFDPTAGVLCDHLYVPCAVGIDPVDVTPILGRYCADRAVGSRLETRVEIVQGEALPE